MENKEETKLIMTKMEEADFQSRAKFLIDTTDLCFKQCIKDFDRKQLTTMEKHCSAGCFNKMIKNYESLNQAFKDFKDIADKNAAKIEEQKK